MEGQEPGLTPVPKMLQLKPPQPKPLGLLAIEELHSQLWLEKSWWERGHPITGREPQAVTPFLNQG